jgi:hypothetical protein
MIFACGRLNWQIHFFDRLIPLSHENGLSRGEPQQLSGRACSQKTALSSYESARK